MDNKMFVAKKAYMIIFLVCIVIALTSTTSHAKYFQRQEYPMILSFVQEPIHYHFTPGEVHSFEIPTSGYYAFQLWGAHGGSSKRWMHWLPYPYEEIYDLGGPGGMVSATGYFEEGEILTIAVGTQGNIIEGGFNGGGNGGSSEVHIFGKYYGGGGGGATGVRYLSEDLDGRILIAGGGGGASGGSIGSGSYEYQPSYGGYGGNMESMNEENGWDRDMLNGGKGSGEGGGVGGTQKIGGDGSENGDFGFGGNGSHSGGGGGAGYFGGGGSYGSDGGGGGGSSFIDSKLVNQMPLMPWIPRGMPDRSGLFSLRDGYAIVSYVGDYENIKW